MRPTIQENEDLTNQTVQACDPERLADILGQRDERLDMHIQLRLRTAQRELSPFWPTVVFFTTVLNIALALAAIITGGLVIYYADAPPRPASIRILGVISTAVAGVSALLKGTGMPESAYKVSRAIQAHIEDVIELRTTCMRCGPYDRKRRSGWDLWQIRIQKPIVEETEEEHIMHRKRWEVLAAEWDLIRVTISRTGSQAFGALVALLVGIPHSIKPSSEPAASAVPPPGRNGESNLIERGSVPPATPITVNRFWGNTAAVPRSRYTMQPRY